MSTYFVLSLIGIYRLIFSPLMGGNCRFYPSCSHYAEEAFHKHNFFSAFKLVIQRLWSCRPFGATGYDPVPGVNKNE